MKLILAQGPCVKPFVPLIASLFRTVSGRKTDVTCISVLFYDGVTNVRLYSRYIMTKDMRMNGTVSEEEDEWSLKSRKKFRGAVMTHTSSAFS